MKSILIIVTVYNRPQNSNIFKTKAGGLDKYCFPNKLKYIWKEEKKQVEVKPAALWEEWPCVLMHQYT